MKRALYAALLVGLAACDDSTQPTAPTNAPPASVVRQFTPRNLGTLGGDNSGGVGINALGEVVGHSPIPSGAVRAFLWRDGQGMKSLGTLGGFNSRARGINDRSEVTGFSEIRPDSPVNRAFIWREAGGMRTLGTLGGENSQGNAINNKAEVTGTSDLRNGQVRAFLWAPGRG